MPGWKSDALIIDAVRSPIGRKNGTLSAMRGDELAGQVLNALVERVGVEPGEVEDVQAGCVTQIGEQGWNIGRMVPLVAGWPETVSRHHRRPPVRFVDADELQAPRPRSGPGSSTSSSRQASR